MILGNYTLCVKYIFRSISVHSYMLFSYLCTGIAIICSRKMLLPIIFLPNMSLKTEVEMPISFFQETEMNNV